MQPLNSGGRSLLLSIVLYTLQYTFRLLPGQVPLKVMRRQLPLCRCQLQSTAPTQLCLGQDCCWPISWYFLYC
jgi:hypothetical protein